MVLFTLVFYGIFARFREQACTFICPYGRLQSTVLDEHSIVVAYDYKRGEKRGPWRREQPVSLRQQTGTGDCIDCFQCVAVCPTGIDIRNGTQMECVHCTACIDACNGVMKKIGRPAGLIRYASLNGIERGARLRLTPRLAGYAAVLVALIGQWTILVFTRSDVQTTLLRAPGTLFQQKPDGRFSNLYLVKVVNKTSRPMPLELRLEDVRGDLRLMGGALVVPAQQLAQDSILIQLDRGALHPGMTPLVVGVYSNGKRIETLKTAFIGPRDDVVK
jgi:cytochrome c oxidase accessory protein FixG